MIQSLQVRSVTSRVRRVANRRLSVEIVRRIGLSPAAVTSSTRDNCRSSSCASPSLLSTSAHFDPARWIPRKKRQETRPSRSSSPWLSVGRLSSASVYVPAPLRDKLAIAANIKLQILRPRWQGLYAARKKHTDKATELPELPRSFLGWILPLWRITDQQVLAAAGLDAYVVCIRFLTGIE
jgi:hypothetical protein